MGGNVTFTTILAISCAAPVPIHLMKEQAPIGTWVRHNTEYLIVVEIKTVKGVKYYKLLGVKDSKSLWATEASVLAVIRDSDKFFLIFVDLEEDK